MDELCCERVTPSNWEITLRISSLSASLGENITGSLSGSVHALRIVNTDPTDDGFADNINIETEADSILDFTEQNPFGIP